MHGGNQMEILKAMEHAPLPLDEVIYELSIEELEGLKIADEMKEPDYGDFLSFFCHYNLHH